MKMELNLEPSEIKAYMRENHFNDIELLSDLVLEATGDIDDVVSVISKIIEYTGWELEEVIDLTINKKI